MAEETRTQDSIGFASEQRRHHRRYIFGLELVVGIEVDDDICSFV